MPIEIMELVVRARVRDEERNEENLQQSTAGDASGTAGRVAATEEDLQRAAEVVQEILKRQKER